jgi:hypothetical protein
MCGGVRVIDCIHFPGKFERLFFRWVAYVHLIVAVQHKSEERNHLDNMLFYVIFALSCYVGLSCFSKKIGVVGGDAVVSHYCTSRGSLGYSPWSTSTSGASRNPAKFSHLYGHHTSKPSYGDTSLIILLHVT